MFTKSTTFSTRDNRIYCVSKAQALIPEVDDADY